ncbi:MAG TPA: hypothetical protein VM537_16775 [Anaerolineae bacterium]|nr:hypothetical protein [Anaerolineae bacterium]
MFAEAITRLVLSAGPWLVVGMGICSLLIVVIGDWRFSLMAFGLQSVLLALLNMRLLPFEWAALRMLVGGLVALLWFISARRIRWGGRQEPARWWLLRRGRGERWPLLSTGPLMRWLAVGLAGVVFFRLQGRLTLPVLPADLGLACSWLWLMGFLAMAISDEPLRAGMGLLTMSWGFQLLYSALAPSHISIGLLSGLDLLVGLAVAYLMVARGLAGRPLLARLLGVREYEETVPRGQQ